MKNPSPLPHRLLPPDVIRLLQQAVRIRITQSDPLARIKAIEKTTEQIKRHYPPFFKE